MNYKIAMRFHEDPTTAPGSFESVALDEQVGSGSTLDASIDSRRSQKTWVNLTLASFLTLSPVNIAGPIDIPGRRQGIASATIYDWFDLAEDFDDGFIFPGGLLIPYPERKILFRKSLKLEGLEKRQPFLSL